MQPSLNKIFASLLIFTLILILMLIWKQDKFYGSYSEKLIKRPKDPHISVNVSRDDMAKERFKRPWDMEVSCCFRFRKNRKYKFPNYNQCAYVASSGHLLGSGAGIEIDGADFVIRTNDAPTGGYEKDVGTKTTMRYMASTGANIVMKNPEPLFNGTSKPEMLIFHANNPRTRLAYKLYPEITNLRLQSEGHSLLNGIVRYYGGKLNFTRAKLEKPTGGIKAIIIAMQMCKNVTVYGIASPHHCRNVKSSASTDVSYHYYDPPVDNLTVAYGQKECYNYNKWGTTSKGHHDIIFEKYIYAVWMREGANLAFRFPHWTYQDLEGDSLFDNYHIH